MSKPKSKQSAFTEIERHLTDCKESLAKLAVAADGRELRKAWEDFLFSFHRTMGRTITLALSQAESKEWGHRLKRASAHDDEGLVFLREARAAAEHALEPFAQFDDPLVRIGGNAIVRSGNSSATFVGNKRNGRDMGDFTISTTQGRVNKVSGTPRIHIQEVPATIRLTPIWSDEKRKTFPPPKSIDGIILNEMRPHDLASVAFQFIESRLGQLRKLLADPK